MEYNTKDLQGRKWMLTINNPDQHGWTNLKIQDKLLNISTLEYMCMSDEKGLERGTLHKHVYVKFNSPVRMRTLKRAIPEAHLERARGGDSENRDYIFKQGRWRDSEKHQTNMVETHFECGTCKEKKLKNRDVAEDIYAKVKSGMTLYEIIEEKPEYSLKIDKIKGIIDMVEDEELKGKIRDVQVHYICGKQLDQVIQEIYEKFGANNIYRVTDLKYPFEGYRGEDVILFGDFLGEISQNQIKLWMNKYPLRLRCRYQDKWARYTKVFILSRRPPQFLCTYSDHIESEFLSKTIRTITEVDNDYKTYSLAEYYERKNTG